MDFLRTLKIVSPVFPNEHSRLVTLDADAAITDGFQSLISNNILSVPIYDASTGAYTGLLSMVDVVLHALASLNESDLDSGACSAMNIFSSKEAFRHAKVKDIAGKSKQAPVTIDSTATADHVIEKMLKTKAHHVLGLDNTTGELKNVLTQSRIVECLSTLFGVDPTLTMLGAKTVQELSLGIRDVLCVTESTKASDAFRLLADAHVSGVAVVRDVSGGKKTLVGNISVRDLRAIRSNASFLKLLSLPVSEYLEVGRGEYNVPKSVVTCSLGDTYRDVVQRVVENKVHRCYVVNEQGDLIGVVSLWDLLSKLATADLSVNAP